MIRRTSPPSHLFFIICLVYTTITLSSVVIPGDQTETTKSSFSFPISKALATNTSRTLYVASGTKKNKEFAIASLSGTKQEAFVGITPEQITLNGTEKSNNPLFNAEISHLALIEITGIDPTEHLIAASINSPTLYAFERSHNGLLSIELPDATGTPTGGITQIAASSQGIICVAVKPCLTKSSEAHIADQVIRVHIDAPDITAQFDGELPETNSQENSTTETIDPDAKPKLEEIDFQKIRSHLQANHVDVAIPAKLVPTHFGDPGSGIAVIFFTKENGSKLTLRSKTAFPLDTHTNVLKIGGHTHPVPFASERVALHWDNALERLYIGLQVAPVNGGARALLVARIDDNKFVLEAAVPDAAFDTTHDAIVGSLTAPTAIHEIKSMSTSTAHSYVITRGGTGNPDDTTNIIQALPVVANSKNAAFIGTIASKIPGDRTTPASTPDAMTSFGDAAALVGAGTITTGKVASMSVYADTVFACTTEGVFYSQALFDAAGAIKRWTIWQRYAGITTPTRTMVLDTKNGIVTTVSQESDATPPTVYRTQWTSGTAEKTESLIQAIGPVEQLFDFPAISTPGLDTIALTASVYNDTMSITQTGSVSGNAVQPSFGSFRQETFTEGAITKDVGTDTTPTILRISGGDLTVISPLVQVAIGKVDGGSGWLFCGGDKGLAVLSTPTHEGWNALGTGLRGFTRDMSFKVLGNYSYIKKLVIDGSFLYVLTDTALDRIALNTSRLDPENLHTTRLASIEQAPFAHTFFNDLIVSDIFALLATKDGLFRVGNGAAITTATNQHEVAWTAIEVPDNYAGPVTHLYAKSLTGRMQDCAKSNTDGQVYVLCGDRSMKRGQLNRFAIASVQTPEGITDETILPFATDGAAFRTNPKDYSYYVNFGQFRDLFTTDGAMMFHARGQDNAILTNVQAIPHFLVPTDIKAGRNIPSMIHVSASGIWFVANEKGIHSNE